MHVPTNQKLLLIFTTVSCLLIWLNTATAGTFHVSTEEEFNSALSRAASNGEDDEILLYEGMYNGNFIYFAYEDNSLSITGGYNVDNVKEASYQLKPTTSLYGQDSGGSVLTLYASGYDVDFYIEALCLYDGQASDGSGGGGLYVFNKRGSVSLKGLLVADNRAESGAGVLLYSPSNVLVRNCYFHDNVGASHGGGINIVPYSGTDFSLDFTNNILEGNEADYGGGLRLYATSGNSHVYSVSILNNTIVWNKAAAAGGGIYIDIGGDSDDNLYLYNNIIYANKLTSIDQGYGKDIYIDNAYTPLHLYHNDFDQSDSGIYLSDPITIDSSNLNDVFPLFDYDPHYYAPYELSHGSKCIDSGTYLIGPTLPELDFEGNHRIIGNTVDMGAYESPYTRNRKIGVSCPFMEWSFSRWVKVGDIKKTTCTIYCATNNTSVHIVELLDSLNPPFTLEKHECSGHTLYPAWPVVPVPEDAETACKFDISFAPTESGSFSDILKIEYKTNTEDDTTGDNMIYYHPVSGRTSTLSE